MSLHFEILPVTPFLQNCTLLWCDETSHAVLSDPGGETKRLLNVLHKKNLQLQAVWLTHGHVDHVGGVVSLVEKTGVPILGPHEGDDYWLAELPKIANAYHFEPTPSFTPNRWLKEGDTLSVGRHTFKVRHIPGHTPGHVVFYNENNKLLIAGDVIFMESIGRTDFPGSNHQDLIRNIHHKILTLPGDTNIIPGHGATTTVAHEIATNPFL